MIKINTYLKIKNSFINIADFNGKISDVFYIEGAIEIFVDDKKIIGMEMWDYVDQLWAYIAAGLEETKRGHAFKTFFPDQPIELVLKPIPGRDLLNVAVVYGGKNVQVVVPMDEFLHALLNAAQEFFETMRMLVPENAQNYDHALIQIKALLENE